MIRAQARAAAARHAPLLLSFGHEPENERNGSPAAYVVAWRHYVAVFRAEHATNVRFVWILMASRFHPRGGRIPAAAYYPGDDVIDWLAVDGYNWFGWRSDTWRPFTDVFADFVDWATPHRRPLMVAEWGSLKTRHARPESGPDRRRRRRDPPLAAATRRPLLERHRPRGPLRLHPELLAVGDGRNARPRRPAVLQRSPSCEGLGAGFHEPNRIQRLSVAVGEESCGTETRERRCQITGQ